MASSWEVGGKACNPKFGIPWRVTSGEVNEYENFLPVAYRATLIDDRTIS